jgi:hypothetical protein
LNYPSKFLQGLSRWEKRFFYVSVFCFLLSLVFGCVNKLYTTTKAKNVAKPVLKNTNLTKYIVINTIHHPIPSPSYLSHQASYFMTITVIFVSLFIIFYILFLSLQVIRELKSLTQFNLNTLDKVTDKAKDERKVVKELSRLSQESLALFEKQVNLHIKEVEARDKVFSNLLPLIAGGWAIYFISNFPALANKSFYGVVIGVSGLAAIALTLLKFMLDLGKQAAIITPLERCLALLEQAQAITNKTKN